MISDDERREVARRLREVNPYRNQSHTIPCNRYTPAVEYLSELAGALGYSPRNDVSRLEFQNRLADLIEPSEPEVKYVAEVKIDGWRLEELAHDAAVELTGIDRDALLELVKELELGAQCFVGRKWTNTECERMAKHLADDYEMIASRIREALGVDE